MSELLLASKSDLVAIADKIRAKAGISNSLSFPQGFMDGIDEISGSGQGGSGGSSSGTSGSYADQLYEFYGVDKGVYPYLAIAYNPSPSSLNVDIVFGDVISSTTSTRIIFANNMSARKTPTSTCDYTDIESVCSMVMNEIETVSNKAVSRLNAGSSTVYVYTNFDASVLTACGGLYRLDEVEETLPYDGLVNGYDVMFYDENNEGLAFYSIKQGQSIEAPLYTVDSWETVDGTLISFPYAPTSDIVLYANVPTYATKLYEHFGIDVAEYPYLALHSQSGNRRINFSKTVTKASDWYLTMDNGYWGKIDSIDLTETDLHVLVESVINTNISLSRSSGALCNIYNTTDTKNLHANFNPADFGLPRDYVSLV